ncbi:MAG: molybdopterin-guanine dinucleotide biosynthesis protein B [Deltaproteobacteria bacterium]|nr:molybdopterin-guanine dinucleotide biosynthesis protein B [Deltaproteobacteria bacterium]
MSGTPVICICGKKNSGKTTLMEKLINVLSARNLKVGTLKHDRHGFEMDVEGKDTWRHRKAGAVAVAIASPGMVAMIRMEQQEPGLDDLVQLIGKNVDLVLAEGFKTSDKPKIEVIRAERSTEAICSVSDALVAVASDLDRPVPGIPCFALNDSEKLADFIVSYFNIKV